MAIESLVWVGELASKDTQMRYIVHATVDEYLLPCEIIDYALSECETLLRREKLTHSQAGALSRLIGSIRASGDFLNGFDRSNIADLIERDPHWVTLRERAGEVLRAFSGELDHLLSSD